MELCGKLTAKGALHGELTCDAQLVGKLGVGFIREVVYVEKILGTHAEIVNLEDELRPLYINSISLSSSAEGEVESE